MDIVNNGNVSLAVSFPILANADVRDIHCATSASLYRMDRKAHWDRVYSTKTETDVSWFQAEPALSLRLIRECAPQRARVIDVGGGGASVLVDRLLANGFEIPAVLDVSTSAIDRAKARLGTLSTRVDWIVGDVTEVDDLGQFDVWHDRAVFHFLTEPDDRKKYATLAARTVRRGGHLILAAFAIDGPARCSGLDVRRYDAKLASTELGPAFELVKQTDEMHLTPQGKPQHFFYGVFRRTCRAPIT